MLEEYAVIFSSVGLLATGLMILDMLADLRPAARAEKNNPDNEAANIRADYARFGVGVECVRIVKHCLILFALAYAARSDAPLLLTSCLMCVSLLITATSLWGLSFRIRLRRRLLHRGTE